jgi:hypothetical protein
MSGATRKAERLLSFGIESTPFESHPLLRESITGDIEPVQEKRVIAASTFGISGTASERN